MTSVIGKVIRAAPGLTGFDVDSPLTIEQAQGMKSSGYDFCIRYIPRKDSLTAGNLTTVEANNILKAGLCLSVVQHVSLPGWLPTAELGKEYGAYAAKYLNDIGIPTGICVFLDLEEVSRDASSQNVVDYCNFWFDELIYVGYMPSLYVGYSPGLSMEDIYERLSFTHYWRAYNADELPGRGYQLVQHPQKVGESITYDPNTTQLDKKGGSIIWLAPA